MAKKSQRVIELENELRDARNETMHARRAMCALMPGSKSKIVEFGADSNTCSVRLILTHGETGRPLNEPTVIISDHTGDYVTHEPQAGFSGLKYEAHKPLGQFHSNEDYSRRVVCNEAFEYLMKWERGNYD